MALELKFLKNPRKKSDAALGFVFDDLSLSSDLEALDKKIDGYIAHAIKNNETFKGKLGQTLKLSLPKAANYSQLVICGLGDSKELTAQKSEEAGGKATPILKSLGHEIATILGNHDKLSDKHLAHLSMGIALRSYSFERYKSEDEPDEAESPKKSFKVLDIVSDSHTEIEEIYGDLGAITQGVYLARDLVNEPPNHLHPENYAQTIKDELKPLGVEVEIIDEKKMQKMGMGAILAVGMGSAQKPRIVVMRWNNSNKKTANPIALVGKGVTFDTGGISIKPAAGMDEMKMDMGGSAAVVGAMKSLALRKSESNVVGIVGLAENMPSDCAYRPGDIVKSYSGKTIEILNTDAEGRLVLADVLTYVQEKYSPKAIIDLATLTGAMMIALGHEYCGTFANDDALWTQMDDASQHVSEKLWRMPLDEVWKKAMVSDTADLQNLGKIGRFGGACTAAGFLEHFIDEGTPWAHMDIAGTAWVKKDQPTVPKFGTGFGVRTLDRLISDYYET